MNSESRSSPGQNSDPTQITLNMGEMLLDMMVLTEMHSESLALRKAEAMSNLSVKATRLFSRICSSDRLRGKTATRCCDSQRSKT